MNAVRASCDAQVLAKLNWRLGDNTLGIARHQQEKRVEALSEDICTFFARVEALCVQVLHKSP